MLKQYANILRRFVILFDALLIIASFIIAKYIRMKLIPGLFLYNFFVRDYYIWSLPVIVIIWVSILYFLGMYKSIRLKKPKEVSTIVIKSALLTFTIFASLAYLLKVQTVSRSFVAIFFLVTTFLLIAEKIALLIIVRQLRQRGFNFRNILLVGTCPRVKNFAAYLEKHRELGLKVIGFISEDEKEVGADIGPYKVLGDLDTFGEVLKNNIVDSVIVIVPRTSLDKVEPIILHCELVGVSVNVAVDLFNPRFAKIKETSMMDIPMITCESTPPSVSLQLIKRFIDIAVSFVGLIIISPLYFAVVLAIKLNSPGPVYFIQERVGLNGRIFKLYKFRTMVIDAEEKLAELMKHNEMQGPAFKMDNDPRITPIGRFLRKYSIDEIPQLWNVLHGDMSLVGPRPPLPREVKQYDPWHQRRLSMRPGITCLWQVSGRNKITDFNEWVRLDLEYIDNWSLLLDFKILLRTIPAVLLTRGAK